MVENVYIKIFILYFDLLLHEKSLPSDCMTIFGTARIHKKLIQLYIFTEYFMFYKRINVWKFLITVRLASRKSAKGNLVYCQILVCGSLSRERLS